jgi:hypothetical protein
MVLLMAVVCASTVRGARSEAPEGLIEQFLAKNASQPAYRGTRHLEAENGDQKGWLDAAADYSPAGGFRYRVIAEGGSASIRSRVLKAVLDGERDLIARGADAHVTLAPANYHFQATGIDDDGLANVLVAPRRKEEGLVFGTMFLKPVDGVLVRLEGRLAKSPSFWVKDVDIVRTYQNIEGVVLPIALESRAQVRFLGEGRLRMTYTYSEIDGRPLAARD